MTRDRGNYGPPDADDRERHWAAGWAGNQTLDYVRDQTVGAALRPAMPFIQDVYNGSRGAQRLWNATREIGGRDEAEKPAIQIGHELVHTVADRERAMSKLSTGFRALSDDLAGWMSRHKSDPALANVATSVAHWIVADVTPTLAEWADFLAHERKSWWTKMATSWDTFEGWSERLKHMRALARAHGVTLQSPEPEGLPKTIWQRSEQGNGSEALAILGVLKIGALTALSIMGAAGLYSAIRGLREKAQATDEQIALRRIVREELNAASASKK